MFQSLKLDAAAMWAVALADGLGDTLCRRSSEMSSLDIVDRLSIDSSESMQESLVNLFEALLRNLFRKTEDPVPLHYLKVTVDDDSIREPASSSASRVPLIQLLCGALNFPDGKLCGLTKHYLQYFLRTHEEIIERMYPSGTSPALGATLATVKPISKLPHPCNEEYLLGVIDKLQRSCHYFAHLQYGSGFVQN